MSLDHPTSLCPRRYPFGEVHTLDLEADYRDCGPVTAVQLPSGAHAWLVTDHELARRVLRADPVFSREQANRPEVARLSTEVLPDWAILATDPPRHTWLRTMIAGMFAPRQIAAMAPAITALAHGLVDELEAAGNTADIVSGFTEPFAAAVVCEMFDVPEQFRHQVFALGDALTARDASSETLTAARGECETLARAMAEQNPRGLFGMLGESVSTDEAVLNLIIACLIGGRGSPTVFLSSALFALLRERRRYQHLVDHPDAIAAAVEELLRFVPVGVGGGFTRVATVDVELGPVQVRAGEAVIPAMHVANRDPKVFEHPDELILDRGTKLAHLAFGHGAHYCVGAGLARLEARVALETLTTRLPALRLADSTEDCAWRHGRVVRSLERLDVAWTRG
ncbi:cytochrome P450 [Nocardia abscessus]|uniref:cytochrome P450 n=1 Tax=Nocardia abscessus TaxID=120957 RepID=UPI0002D77605|nr:cytochrome P450 [Nocardia abscessus]MCC3328280.1 cytochrome P450 [Nocardia abscessus]